MRKCIQLLFSISFLFIGLQQLSAQCNEPESPGVGANACETAPIFCSEADLDGYCSTTYASGVGPCPADFCGSCENYMWVGFIANSTTIQLEISASNCAGTPNGSGVQAHMYDGCSNPMGVSDCWSSGAQGTGVITATGLNPGQVYYLMIDGWAGDACEWSVNVLQGVGDLPPPVINGTITGPLEVCPGAILDYSVPPAAGATNYEWTITPAIGAVTSGQGTPDAQITWGSPGVAQLCVTPSNFCESGPPVCQTVIVTPIPPTFFFEDVCLGETVLCDGTIYQGPGVFETIYDSWLGCDSSVTCVITLLPIVIDPPYTEAVCVGECVEFDGADVCETGAYSAVYDTWQGCDSTVTLILIVVDAEAIVADPAILGCGGGGTVVLDGTGSTVAPTGGVGIITYEWTGPPGANIIPDDEIIASTDMAGSYTLTVTQDYDGLICTDSYTVEVTEDVTLPDDPNLNGPNIGCEGGVNTYTASPGAGGGPAPTGYTWTVTGGTFVDNGNSIDVTWTNQTSGQVCVTADNDCGPSGQVCIDVTLGAGAEDPNLTGPTEVCDGQILTYEVNPADPTATYAWTVSGGASFIDNGSFIDVDFDGASDGQVCVIATNSCGPSTEICLDFMVLDVPTQPTIMGPDDLCLGQTETYSVMVDPNATSYVWTVDGGTFVDNGTSIDVTWDQTGGGEICVTAENVCGSTNQVCFQTTVNPAPSATISGSGEFCAGSGDLVDLTIELTGTGPWTVTYQLNGGNDVTIPIISSPFVLQVSEAGTYTILSVTDQSSCPGIPNGMAVVTENPLPTAIISGDESICAGSGDCGPLTINFTGTGPWSIIVAIDAVATAPINGIVDNPFTYDGCAAGAYTIAEVTDANGCVNTGSGTGTITEDTAPMAIGIMDVCDVTNTEFTITFEITGGDPASYTVNGSTVGISAGPPYIFTSMAMPTGSNYSFIVDDANGCAPVTVSGIVVCDCTTEVGTMDQAPLTACGNGSCITAIYDASGEVLDGDDAVEFVLHEGSGLSIVNEIARNIIPEFCFDANLGMTYGTTYYISAIVGNDIGGGTVDVTDPCLEVAQGTPVVYNEDPTATLADDPIVCAGEVAEFTVTFTGPGPYSITFEDPNAVATTLSGISANPYILQVVAPISGTYCLTEVSNNNCVGVADGCGTVTVNNPPVVANVTTACNLTATAFVVTFEITDGDSGSYVVDPPGSGVLTPGNPAIFTSNEIAAGNIYLFEVYDANGCDTIIVTTAVPVDCDCVSSTGTMDQTPLDICGDGPAIATYVLAGQVLDGDDVLEFALHTGSGASLGTIIDINDVPEFSFDPNLGMMYGVTYYISAMVGSDDGTGSVNYPVDLCLDVAVGTPVTFFEVPTADLSGSIDICLGDTTNVQVALTGDAPYTVVITDGTDLDTITGINSSPFNYQVNPGTTTTYTLVEASDENCPAIISGTATVTVNEAPTVGIANITINANNTGYIVCFDIMGGETPYIITNGIDTLSTQSTTEFCSAELPCGTGFYFEVDDGNDCGPIIVEQAIVDCPCITQVGTMDGTMIEICGNGPADATYDPAIEVLDGNDAVNYFIHNGDNVPIQTAATPSFSFTAGLMTYGTTYFISAQAGDDNGTGGVITTDPCLSISVGTPVVFYEIPSVTLSGGGDICIGECTDLQIDVVGGEAPYTVIYETGAGVMDTVVSVTASFTVEVCPTATTVYNLASLEDANCVGTVTGFATVNINQPPTGINVLSTIDATNTFYTLCFDIVGGDPATYNIDPPGTIIGTTYCSDPIPCGDDYFFLLDDANFCGPDTISGSVFCPCLSEAGMMTAGLIEDCEGATISVDPAVGEVLDGNDVQQYVLHTSAANALGTVLMINDIPSFTYDGAIVDCGVTYYISSVVGDDDGTGVFDPDDFCLSVAFGQPVRWNCSPSAELTGGATLCEGDVTSIIFNLTGSGPFDVVLNNGVMDTTFTDLTDGFVWDITPGSSVTYSLVSVTNTLTGCSSLAVGSVTITVNTIVNAGTIADEVRLCEDLSLVVTLADLLDGEDAGGLWSETSGIPSTGGAFNAVAGTFNTVGQAPGTYLFRYFLDAGDPCPDDENTVTVIIDPVPVADAGEDREITCDDAEWTLGGSATSIGTDLTYEWVELVSATVVGSSPELPVTDAGTYQLTVTNVVTGCTSFDQAIVENSVAYPIPEVSVSDISCFGDEDGFFVIESITGGVPPYVCSLNGGPFTQQKQFTNLSAGVYELVILDSKGCETFLTLELEQPEELVVEIVTNIQGDDPIVELGDSIQITAVISIDSVDVIQWSPEGLVACDTCSTTWAYPEVQTTFSVMVQEGECSDSDSYTVFVEKKRPVYIPNIFSPTSTSGNDIFFISSGPQVARIRSFLVFDRWGETVFEYYNFLPNNPAYGWDGNHRGQAMNPGVFVYYAEIEFIDGSVELYEGDVTLVR